MEFVDPSYKPTLDEKIEISRRALQACKRSGTKEQVAAEEVRLAALLAQRDQAKAAKSNEGKASQK